jgi:Na+/H+-dicarboxylate symporter
MSERQAKYLLKTKGLGMLKLKLHWQILIAILLAILAGTLSGTQATFFDIRFYDVYVYLGALFMNALKMIIVPLIVASIITGMSSMGSGRHLGRMGGKTVLYYTFTSLVAILIGVIVVNVLQPGIINGQPAGTHLGLAANTQQVLSNVEGRGLSDLTEIFLRMIPANIVQAAAAGQMLGLIFFGLLFGYFMMRIEKSLSDTLVKFWKAVFETMMAITMLIMRFAPIGVFGLVAKTVAETGFAAFQPLMFFFVTVLIALGLHLFVVLPLILKYLGGTSPRQHFKNMSPALLTAFSTSSSSATLPITMECVEKNAKISNQVTSFVLPLGATVNMDGTALYECVAALFLAQAYGLHLGWATQVTVVFTALLTSIGVAGIPAASLVAITIILGAIGLPLEAVGFILVTDRFLDMCRTAVNVFSDSCGAVVIQNTEDRRLPSVATNT